ncbi:MAG TPA: hypothetical protein VK466_04555 [Terriglobales bacterium]|nr:hypothetical protein [Terriglobales bacterium]
MPTYGHPTAPKHSLSAIVPIIVLFYPLSLVTQQAQGPSSPKFDAQTETQMKGTVDDVRLPSSAKEIVYLRMKTDPATTVEVYLCPKSFLDDMGVTFSKGDEITLSGSKVKQGDADLILAREIVKKSDTLVLRDGKGRPVWS